MNFGKLNRELRFSEGLIGIEAHWGGMMEKRTRTYADGGRLKEYRRPQPQGTSKKSPSDYFSLESFVVLLCLTASLLILPLILPPLPPPPSMLLLVPIGILGVLLILAFMPSDVRDIASSYL